MTAARLTLDPRFPIGAVRRRLFGGFVEHLGRHVYDGIYEPGHPRPTNRASVVTSSTSCASWASR